MELSKLINGIKAIQVSGEVERKDINSICYDSRGVRRGSMFAAIKGLTTDGHTYIQEAISRGASAIILEDDTIVPDSIYRHANVAKILVRDSRKALAEAAHTFYKEPSKNLRLIGCGGTNGKTTTTWIIKNLLERNGQKSGMLGTIANYIGERKAESSLTTPESSDLNFLLSEMITASCSHAVMEVSSHALALSRVFDLEFAGAIFTNLSQDHLDFHKTIEHYRDTKKMLYDSLDADSYAISNGDDPLGTYMMKDTAAKKYLYGTGEECDFRISDIHFDLNGTVFTLTHEDRNYPVSSRMIGIFNTYNITAAIASCYLEGIAIQDIISGLRHIPQVPGRFEQITDGSRTVIIDYSHTPDSLEKTLLNIRDIIGNTRPLITVFGCGGNRDKGKRPIMGRIASDLSDSVIITSDNPREEDPFAIINDIEAGITRDNFIIEESREDAIKTAIRQSGHDAVILLAGKGHEDYQIIGKEKIHLSDKEIAQCYLNGGHKH